MVKNPAQKAGLVAEMQAIVREAAEPRQPVDGIKAAVGRAARALGISYSRAMTFWYGHTERVRISSEEAERMRAQREWLYQRRLERLRHDIAVTERLLEEAKRRHAQTAAVACDPAPPGSEVDYALGNCVL